MEARRDGRLPKVSKKDFNKLLFGFLKAKGVSLSTSSFCEYHTTLINEVIPQNNGNRISHLCCLSTLNPRPGCQSGLVVSVFVYKIVLLVLLETVYILT